MPDIVRKTVHDAGSDSITSSGDRMNLCLAGASDLAALIFGLTDIKVPEKNSADTRSYGFQNDPRAHDTSADDPQFRTSPAGKSAAAANGCGSMSPCSRAIFLWARTPNNPGPPFAVRSA